MRKTVCLKRVFATVLVLSLAFTPIFSFGQSINGNNAIEITPTEPTKGTANIYSSNVLSRASATKAANLSYYNSVEEGYVTSIKQQSPYGSCWAFAMVAAAETSVIKKGYETNALDLSEAQLVHFYYNRCNDPLGNTAGDVNPNRSGLPDGDAGGSATYAVHTLAGWTGLTTEQKLPYSKLESGNISDDLAYDNEYILNNSYRVAGPNDGGEDFEMSKSSIKDQIAEHGSVVVSYSTGYSTGNGVGYYCYDEGTGSDHAVVIVGWDDNYSKNKLTVDGHTPSENGAWIIKNSWGTQAANGGYQYISYEDKSVEGFTALDMIPADEYDYNYYYDGSAWNSYKRADIGDKIANVYQVKSSTKGNDVWQRLEAVGFYTYSPQVDYSISIYVSNSKPGTPVSGQKAATVQGRTYHEGYYTTELNEPVVVKKGQYYSVVITLQDVVGSTSVKYGVEATRWDHYIGLGHDAVTKKGQSYQYDKSGKRWLDLKNQSPSSINAGSCCARIKGLASDAELSDIALSRGSVSKITRTSKTKITATAKKDGLASGYQFGYSTAKNGKYKTVNSTSTKKTISKLKSGKRYYIKVRAYVNFDGLKKYGAWSTAKRSK